MAEEHVNILMVGGNARKSGKTTMICRLLEYFERTYAIAAVKVALYGNREIFSEHYPEASGNGYLEIKENSPYNKKDSGKFLAAGAAESWFIAAVNGKEDKVIQKIKEIENRVNFMILESNVIRKYIEPGVFIMVINSEKEVKASAREVFSFADLHVDTVSERYENIESYIGIDKNKWILNHPL